jgi:hypothetical protein
MKKRFLMIISVLLLATLACNFPGLTATPTLEVPPTATPDLGMQLYEGRGMRLLLPPAYVEEDIKDQLPQIMETLTSLIGGEDSPLGDLVKNLEEEVCWWGYDSAAPAVSPTRLLIIRNSSLAGMPISMLTLALEQILGSEKVSVDQDNINLGGRDVTRLVYSDENNAWAGYVFKEDDQLWLTLFMTTPANLAAQQSTFEISVGSIEIDSAQP